LRCQATSTVVDRPREEVYDFLEDLANHEAFTDHMMVDWQGGGDRVTVRSKVMRSDRMTTPRQREGDGTAAGTARGQRPAARLP
jgi:hypothetical protein